MTAQHTPGPWAKVEDADNRNNVRIRSDALPHVAKVYGYSRDDAARDANARLIAAAPELLEALEAAASMLPEETCIRHGITDALAKARGHD